MLRAEHSSSCVEDGLVLGERVSDATLIEQDHRVIALAAQGVGMVFTEYMCARVEYGAILGFGFVDSAKIPQDHRQVTSAAERIRMIRAQHPKLARLRSAAGSSGPKTGATALTGAI